MYDLKMKKKIKQQSKGKNFMNMGAMMKNKMSALEGEREIGGDLDLDVINQNYENDLMEKNEKERKQVNNAS